MDSVTVYDNGNPQINYLLPPLAAAIEDAFVRLAGDGDISVFVILVVAGSRVSWCRSDDHRLLVVNYAFQAMGLAMQGLHAANRNHKNQRLHALAYSSAVN
ncbi:hypothetical protein OUZ56_010988 [Daphnia magna]|nr:hypothetical protein OUZ56_010945 [Daphnia magna]KAK4005832.1 hypothetical protein OUZ56_010956 [Daphnia magna]KAK4005865.1 hypothetical protein OUZ56_010988 [Daphnia magna]